MKQFTPILILGLGLIISHTHGSPNIVKGLIGKPYDKVQSSYSDLDLEALDLETLGDLERLQKRLNYAQKKLPSLPSNYDQTETNPYESQYKSNTYNKNAELSDLVGPYHGKVKDIYSTAAGPLSQTPVGSLTNYPSGLVESVPLQQPYQNSQKEYGNAQLFQLPNGQQLTCVVA